MNAVIDPSWKPRKMEASSEMSQSRKCVGHDGYMLGRWKIGEKEWMIERQEHTSPKDK